MSESRVQGWAGAQHQPPSLAEDPYSEEILADPYPFQARLREAGPVVWLPQYGVYAAGREDSVREIFLAPQSFLSSGGVGLPDIRKTSDYRQPSRINEADPPEHTAVRSVVMRAFSPSRLREIREKLSIEAEQLAETLVEQGSFDGITGLAEAFIFKVFPTVMGVAIPRDNALAIAELRFNQSGPRNRLYDRALEQATPYLEWYKASSQREAVIGEGLASELFEAEDAGLLGPGLASNIVNSLVGGGTDTTIASIGFTLRFLAANPDQFAMARSDAACLRAAFDEALRLEPPSQIVYRTVCPAGVELGGFHLEGNRKLAMFLGAANRDPDRWPDPDRFDVSRKVVGQHVALGTGIHICVGQMLARMEAEAILGALVSRCRAIEPDGPHEYRLMNQVRALRSLPLKVTPA